MTFDIETGRLCNLLTQAARRMAAVNGPIWSSYESGSEIAAFVLECKEAIERGTLTNSQKRELWRIFAPTCDWDDVVGDVLLGEQVFQMIDKPYRTEIIPNSDQS